MYEYFRIIFFIYIIASVFFIKPIYKSWKVMIYDSNIPNRELAVICLFPMLSALVGGFVILRDEWATIKKFLTKNGLVSWWKSL